MAAATYAATGRIAVAYGESGPGSHNLVSALGSAYNNNLAALVITSGVPSALARPYEGMVMETDNLKLFSAVHAVGRGRARPRAGPGARAPRAARRADRPARPGAPGGPGRRARRRGRVRGRASWTLPLERVLPRAAPPPTRTRSRARRSCSRAPSGRWSSRAAAWPGRSRRTSCARSSTRSAPPRPRRRWASARSRPRTRNFFGHGGVIGGDAVLRAFARGRRRPRRRLPLLVLAVGRAAARRAAAQV